MNRAPFHELTGRTDRTSEARVSGEAGAPAKRVVALLPEGVLNQRRTSKARVSGEAPAALLPEGVLNQRRTSKARVSGEAPAALLPEGVLNPVN